jgi:hypothetical protein
MDFTPERVDDGYLKVLIVAQAFVAKVLCKLFAVDSLSVAFKVGAGRHLSYRKRTSALSYLSHQCDVSGIVPNVIPPPFLIFLNGARRGDGDMADFERRWQTFRFSCRGN